MAECPVCNNKSLNYIETGLDGSVTSDGSYIDWATIHVYCRHCGLVFIPEYNRLDYKRFYQYSYDFLMESEDVETVNIFNEGQIKNSEFLINLFSEFIENRYRKTFFDIGSGKGNFISAVNNRFSSLDIYALDPSKSYKSLRLKTFIKEHYNTFFKSEDFSGRFFDYVSLIDDLEHIPDPVSFLNSIKDIMTDDSYLFIQVPNFRNNKYDLLTIDHLSKFTPESLKNLFKIVGLMPVKENTRETVSMEYVVKKGAIDTVISFDIEDIIDCSIRLLKKTIEDADAIRGDFSIYGQGIIANYLVGCGIFKGKNIKVIIDDNRLYHGRQWNGFAKIVGFEEFERDYYTKNVFLAMNDCYHKNVLGRLSAYEVYGILS